MCDESETAFSVISFSNPFNTDTAIISAATPIAVPAIEINVMKEMKLDSFRDFKNRLAKKKLYRIYFVDLTPALHPAPMVWKVFGFPSPFRRGD